MSNNRQRRPEREPEDLALQVLNLHDCFINAAVMHGMMSKTPVVQPNQGENPLHATADDRFRLERLWWTMLYVLVEAWEHRTPEAVAFFSKLPLTAALETRLATLKAAGILDALRACRDYMCHRDRRGYWDDGRMAPHGHLQDVTTLHVHFSRTFHAALDAIKTLPTGEAR